VLRNRILKNWKVFAGTESEKKPYSDTDSDLDTGVPVLSFYKIVQSIADQKIKRKPYSTSARIQEYHAQSEIHSLENLRVKILTLESVSESEKIFWIRIGKKSIGLTAIPVLVPVVGTGTVTYRYDTILTVHR
jgi:hypothetical protein